MPTTEVADQSVLEPIKRQRSESIVLDSPDAKRARTSAGPDTRDKSKKSRRGKKKKKKTSITQPVIASGRNDSNRTPKIGALASTSAILIDEEDEEDDEEVVMLVEPLLAESSKQNSPKDTVDIADLSRDSDKGKEKASPGPTLEAPEENYTARLQAQLAEKSKLVDKYKSALTQLQQNITCQICLDLMYKPFALAPCGHLACYSCLVSWFKAPLANANEPVQSAINRQKTCPHCRTIVRERPVEVWDVKNLVTTLSKTGLLTVEGGSNGPPNTPTPEDPWKDIFRPIRRPNAFDLFFQPFLVDHQPAPPAPGAGGPDMGMYDAEDGGVYRCLDCMHEIFLGRCTGCRRPYPGHVDFNEDEDDDYPSDGDADDFSEGEPIFADWPPFGFIPGVDDDEEEDDEENEYDLHDGFIDDGDALEFNGISEDDDEGSDIEFHPPIVEIVSVGSTASEEDESEDENYPRIVEITSDEDEVIEIDDACSHADESGEESAPPNRRRRIHIIKSDEDEDEDVDVDEVEFPYISRNRSRRFVVDGTSSGHEDDGSVPGPASRLRREIGYDDIEFNSEGSGDENHMQDEDSDEF